MDWLFGRVIFEFICLNWLTMFVQTSFPNKLVQDKFFSSEQLNLWGQGGQGHMGQCRAFQKSATGWPLGFYRISTTKKKPRISTKYRPHSTLSTKYRPQKFLEKRTFTIFTFKSWDIHILGKWGLSWNMRDKWGLFQLRTFRKALYMDHTALCRPYIQTIIETSIKVYVLNLKML